MSIYLIEITEASNRIVGYAESHDEAKAIIRRYIGADIFDNAPAVGSRNKQTYWVFHMRDDRIIGAMVTKIEPMHSIDPKAKWSIAG